MAGSSTRFWRTCVRPRHVWNLTGLLGLEFTAGRVATFFHFRTRDIWRQATPAIKLLGAFTILLGGGMIQAQTPLPYPIKPTITAKMGDLGGKYFGQTPAPAKTHHYYIAAESEQWDFMPIGSDPICGMTPSAEVQERHQVPKARYIQYTDGTFTQRVPQAQQLGILGPVLRGVVGDYLEITFLNRTTQPLSMHPHGVKYDKDSEGSYYGVGSMTKARGTATEAVSGLGAAVAPEAKFTYVWYMDEQSGPLPTEPSSKGWLYHSHVSGDGEINLGLVGCIIVTDPKRARPDGTPNDVDREMATLFMIFNENQGGADPDDRVPTANGGPVLDPLLGGLQLQNGKLTPSVSNTAEAAPGPDGGGPEDENQRFAINGRIFGNLAGLEMNEGERVRWYLFGLGSESDLHTPHWHGLRVIEEGARRTDTVELLPGSMKVADLVADNPGGWLFHCHVAEHMDNGMFALVTVYPKDKPIASRAATNAFLGFPAPALAP